MLNFKKILTYQELSLEKGNMEGNTKSQQIKNQYQNNKELISISKRLINSNSTHTVYMELLSI